MYVCVHVREKERNKEQGGVSPLEQYSRSINQSLTAVKGSPLSHLSAVAKGGDFSVCLNESSRLCVCVRPCV